MKSIYFKKEPSLIRKLLFCIVKFELGLTISAGVSFNKIFAKLGSDVNYPSPKGNGLVTAQSH